MPQQKTLLIVGVGSIGLRHLRCFLSTGRVRASICEINPALRERAVQQHPIAQCYSSLEAALADRHDAAVIATPAHLHVPIAIRLAEAGMHLLVEKPVSASMEGIDTLRQVLQNRNLLAAVGYSLRSIPSLRAMKEAIASGRFGHPVQVIAICGHDFPAARPAYRETYYRDHATGGGAIQDALTHIINAAEWLVGPADRALADAAHQMLDGVNVEDTVHLLTRHGRVLGCYSLNQYQAPSETTITVVCEHGTARFENHMNRWRWMTRPDEPWHDEPGGQFSYDEEITHQANVFLDAMEGRVPPPCSLEEGIQTLRVNLAALASLDQKTWQTVGPDRPTEWKGAMA